MTDTCSAKSSDSPPPNPANSPRCAAHLTGRKRARETTPVFGARLSVPVVSVSRERESGRREGRYFLVGVEEHLLRCAGLKGVALAAVCVGDDRELMISIIQTTAR